MDTEKFIEISKQIHNNKYDYSKVEYVNQSTKVCIICPIHGEFWQVASSHLKGYGCNKCAGLAKLTTSEFIERAKKVHGDKYDYSKVKYEGFSKKVCIICPIHGEFWQIASNHLKGANCPKCAKRFMDKEHFINAAKNIHKDKYDYSKVEYNGAKEKVCIICPRHGEFWQVANYHLNGNGCPKCGREHIWENRPKITTEDFINNAKLIHGDKYDYTQTEYKNSRTKIKIICHKKFKNGVEHGFFYQKPNMHLRGCGCPHCRNSRLENKIFKILTEKNIKFEKEKTYDWLIKNGHMYLDFYLPEFNVAIECQGVQHYVNIKIRGIDKYEKIHENDLLKSKLCKENGIKIFYFTDKNMYYNYCKNKESTYYDFDSMINDIKKLYGTS